MSMFNGIGRVAPDCIRIDMHGNIAVKTSNGYKAYSAKSNRLINCSNFVFDIGDDFFFIIPTIKVEKGDIILMNNKPKCVLEVNDDGSISVINYEDSLIERHMPERHAFMEDFYFFNKIVSLIKFNGSGDGANNLVKFKILSDILNNKGKAETMGMGFGGNAIGMMATMALLGNGFGGNTNSLSDMFNFGELFGFGQNTTPQTTANVTTPEVLTDK